MHKLEAGVGIEVIELSEEKRRFWRFDFWRYPHYYPHPLRELPALKIVAYRSGQTAFETLGREACGLDSRPGTKLTTIGDRGPVYGEPAVLQ